MHSVGIIPARAGSKGLPGKHLRLLGGRPLVDWTFDAARGSRLSRTIVSTDDDAVAAAAREQGVEVPFVRPAALAGDETPMIDVLLHALETLEAGGGARIDVVVLLQPTSPLRRAEHIDAALTILETTTADTVVSVVPVPHRFNPVSVMRLEGGRLVPYAAHPTVTRRQDKPPVLARNGPAVLAVRRHVLLEQRALYGADCRPLLMDEAESIDIDTAWDLAVAECALRLRGGR